MLDEIERWKQLCEQIGIEQDPARFTSLVEELITLLNEKERRLNAQRRSAQAGKGGSSGAYAGHNPSDMA